MKDIYIIMANQNILSFYGTKLDLRVDYSELYDFELSKVQTDYNEEVLDFLNEITYTGLTIDSSCLNNLTTPWEIDINSPYTGNSCNFTVKRRTENGWTLDFVFNGDINESIFYYWGIKNDLRDKNYADNNLTFSFTDDKRIKWHSYHYSDNCDTVSGYTESYYMSSGMTPTLCENGISSDFNITITFDRYKHYTDCDVDNEGGSNDLILGPHSVSYTTTNSGSTSNQIATGYTITNEIKDWVTGATITNDYTESLNKKWSNERQKRLGTLKIYLNGKPIYKIKDFEEVIPSFRESEESIVQIFGNDSTDYITKKIRYYEEPLDYVHVFHNYITTIKPNYEIVECNDISFEPLIGYFDNSLLFADGSNFLTNDNNIILY
jgi:hypothetical protein